MIWTICFSIWIPLFQFLWYPKESVLMSSQINSHYQSPFPTQKHVCLCSQNVPPMCKAHIIPLCWRSTYSYFITLFCTLHQFYLKTGLHCVSVFSRAKEQKELLNHLVYGIFSMKTCYTLSFCLICLFTKLNWSLSLLLEDISSSLWVGILLLSVSFLIFQHAFENGKN